MVYSNVIHATLALVALMLPMASAAPAATTAMTPHGERPIENLHAVPEGGSVEHVDNEVHLIDASGNVIHKAPNDSLERRGTLFSRDNSTTDAFKTGWVAYAGWSNTGSSPISHFETTWSVPPVPKANNGQTVFLFNSIEPKSGQAILQPVLQYGPSAAGGGAYWAVASWYVVGSQSYYTSPVKVSVGKSLKGVMTLDSQSGSKYSYTSSFTNVAKTALAIKNIPELTWATETLEAYSIKSAKDYPAGATVFSDITIRTKAGTPSVTWSAVSDAKDGLKTTVNKQGATNAKITISY
ncbi:hypothetical protein DL93DRAFT_563373 [Clavulina sp. PMI_390]|nr:hypothetical protein DL93DRAFT_563373 [Clavulina sp. PMI_390]